MNYWENEAPVKAGTSKNELDFYRKAQKLAVSRPPWTNDNGEIKRGKTVVLDLAALKDSPEAVSLFLSIKDIREKLKQYKELQALIEEAEAELEAIRDELKAEMTSRNTEELAVDVFKVRWTAVKSSRFDTCAFREAMPDLARKFTKETETRRFTVA